MRAAHLHHALQELARRAAGGREDDTFAAHGQREAGDEDGEREADGEEEDRRVEATLLRSRGRRR